MEHQFILWVTNEIASSVHFIQELTRLEEYHRFYVDRFEAALVGHPDQSAAQVVRYKRKLRDHSEQIGIIEGLINYVNLRQASLVSVLKVTQSQA